MIDVTQHLPHEPPMILIDGMLSLTPPHVVCQCTIKPDFAFLENGCVTPVAMVEVGAQTAAVYMGLHWRTRDVGFLASCRSAEFFTDAYHLGEVLEVHAELVGETERSGSFDCSIVREGIVTARMQLLVVKPPFDFDLTVPGNTPAVED